MHTPSNMFLKYFAYLFLLEHLTLTTAIDKPGFIYNGFEDADLNREGLAEITSNGLLRLTNDTKQKTGHAFYAKPFEFKNTSTGNVYSFSTTFVFAIIPKFPDQGLSGHGIAFVVSPYKTLPGAFPGSYLGLFNTSNNGRLTNGVVAVELDTILNYDFGDIDDNHVGIDFNGLRSNKSEPAGYFADDGFKNLSLISGERMQVWIEYNGSQKEVRVTIAPFREPKPKTPLLSLQHDLSLILLECMYVGLSSSTGSFLTSHYILGWSFRMDGQAQELELSELPRLPRTGPKKPSKILTKAVPVVLSVLVLTMVLGAFHHLRRKRMFAEVFEDWELSVGAHRFMYKDLYIATKGFKDKDLLGSGGFGSVYKGILPNSKLEVAVKRVSHHSKQGIKEFVAEIVTLGQLRHRNLVQLLGYCRLKDELLLVYDYIPNGSLDKFLFSPLGPKLSWSRRFQIMKGVASAVVYLHEYWEKIIIHRDIKASNVLVDGDFNGRLGDFGLARLYDHGTNPQTSHVVGTLGYLAPEMTRTGKAATSTDVFAFGAFLLEVACGRRPIDFQASDEHQILVDRVVSSWSRGDILEACDPNLGSHYVKEEVELSLKLGLLCSQAKPTARPSMRQVLQFLDKDVPLPELSTLSARSLASDYREGFDYFAHSHSCSSSLEMTTTRVSSITDSLLSAGR